MRYQRTSQNIGMRSLASDLVHRAKRGQGNLEVRPHRLMRDKELMDAASRLARYYEDGEIRTARTRTSGSYHLPFFVFKFRAPPLRLGSIVFGVAAG